MLTLKLITDEIIKELKAIQNVPVHMLSRGEEFPLPRMIGVGENRGLYINKRIDDLIERAAQHIHEEIGDFRRTTSIQDLRPLVRSAVGSTLVKIDLDDPTTDACDMVVRETLSVVASVGMQRRGYQEHCLACTLFGFDVPPFEIGAVRFEARNAWLARRLAKGEIGKVTARRITKIWNGEQLRSRRPSWERIYEREIIDLIGDCRYVVSVATDLRP